MQDINLVINQNSKKRVNKPIAFYLSKDEIEMIEKYCEKYLSSKPVFLKILVERFIRQERQKGL